jgi:hypothetical protein
MWSVYHLHGPDRVPIFAAGTRSGYRPFHGIISRGLLNALQAGDTQMAWALYNAWLDPALAGDPQAEGRVPSDLLELARSCRVLRFEESAFVADGFLRRHLDDVFTSLGVAYSPDEVEKIELWNLKEGHTSSVWRVTVVPVGGEAPIRFALNVGRDAAAGEELLASAAILEDVDRRTSEIRIARVLVKALVPIYEGDESQVPVVAQEWIDDACELGFLKERHTQRRRLYAIERFVTAAGEPGRIVSVQGYRLKPDEHDRVVYEILTATLLSSVFDLDRDQVTIPCFEINQGDWVWDGEHAQLVAASAEQEKLRLNEALWCFLFRLSAKYGVRDPEGRKGMLRVARRAVQDFCLRQDTINPATWIDQANQASVEQSQKLEWVGDVKIAVDSMFEER